MIGSLSSGRHQQASSLTNPARMGSFAQRQTATHLVVDPSSNHRLPQQRQTPTSIVVDESNKDGPRCGIDKQQHISSLTFKKRIGHHQPCCRTWDGFYFLLHSNNSRGENTTPRLAVCGLQPMQALRSIKNRPWQNSDRQLRISPDVMCVIVCPVPTVLPARYETCF
jgi:hypothetical protein